jgi:bifunctional enzyme CysN/CysC
MASDNVTSENIFSVAHRVSTEQRARRNRHRGGIVWFTGLSASGKSTLAVELERVLFERGVQVFMLDGDNVRQGLSADLGFSPEARAENIRRIGEVAALFAEAGTIVITAFISPYRADRDRIRARHKQYFHEIYLDAPVEACEGRDRKDLYRRARLGEVKDFTGISAPYEPPLKPELVIPTAAQSVAQSLASIIAYVDTHLLLERPPPA